MKHEIDKELLLAHIQRSDLLGREKLYLEGMVQRNGWIPCRERLPEEYTAVLVFDKDGEMWAGQIDKNGNWCEAADYDDIVPEWLCKVTHWMPLPAGPLI